MHTLVQQPVHQTFFKKETGKKSLCGTPAAQQCSSTAVLLLAAVLRCAVLCRLCAQYIQVWPMLNTVCVCVCVRALSPIRAGWQFYFYSVRCVFVCERRKFIHSLSTFLPGCACVTLYRHVSWREGFVRPPFSVVNIQVDIFFVLYHRDKHWNSRGSRDETTTPPIPVPLIQDVNHTIEAVWLLTAALPSRSSMTKKAVPR